MLPSEIQPFAQANIEALESVHALLVDAELQIPSDNTEEFMHARNKIRNAQRALHRFQVCMADEVAQKERLHDRARHCRLNHKD